MIPAWQLRDMERRELIDALRRLLYQTEDRATPGTRFSMNVLAHAVLALGSHFAHLEFGPKDKDLLLPEGNQPAEVYFRQVMQEVNALARTPEEARAILAQFVREVLVPDAISPFERDLQNQQLMEPERIYGEGITNGTQEVPLPEE